MREASISTTYKMIILFATLLLCFVAFSPNEIMKYRQYVSRVILILFIWFIFSTYYKATIINQTLKLRRIMGAKEIHINEIKSIHHKMFSVVLVHQTGKLRISNLINGFKGFIEKLIALNPEIKVCNFRE